MQDSGDTQSFRYAVDLPPQARMRASGGGAVDIVLAEQVVARFAAPWAKDANASNLKTSYVIEGTTLVQTVATANGTFPVVADPRSELIKTLGIPVGTRLWFSRSETEVLYRNRNYGTAVTAFGTAACAAASIGVLTAVCAAAFTFLTVDFTGNAVLAHRRHYCLWLKLGIGPPDWGEGPGQYCERPS